MAKIKIKQVRSKIKSPKKSEIGFGSFGIEKTEFRC